MLNRKNEDENMSVNVIKEGFAGNNYFRLEDHMFQNREIQMNGTVTMEMAIDITTQLRHLGNLSKKEPITMYINSYGGEVHQGMAIYDTIRSLECPVHTVCVGSAYSMAAIIFVAGDHRTLYENSKVMIHDPSVGIQDRVTPETMEHKLKELKECSDMTVDILHKYTGQNKKVLKGKLKSDSYFTGQEAVEFGLADEVIGVVKNKEK